MLKFNRIILFASKCVVHTQTLELPLSIGSIDPDKSGYPHNTFSYFFHETICCGYSLEMPPLSPSNEYHNISFCGEIRKISVLFY